MTKSKYKYLGRCLCRGSSRNGVGNLFLLNLLLELLTSLLFLNLLHGLFRSWRFYHVGPHRSCRSWRSGRGRFLATGLDLRGWKAPRGGCLDRRVVCWRVDVPNCSSYTLTFKSSFPRFRLFSLGFLNFAEPDGNARNFLPIIVLGPNSLSERLNRDCLWLIGSWGSRLLLKWGNCCFGGGHGFLAGFSSRRLQGFILGDWWRLRRKYVLLRNLRRIQVWFYDGNNLRKHRECWFWTELLLVVLFEVANS